MKTETTNPMTEISNIMNPVRILSVQEWKEIASYGSWSNSLSRNTLNLLSRFESLTSQPLTKEMFVCEVEKPNILDENWKPEPSNKHFEIKKRTNEYQAAQSKIWFEGFEYETNTFSNPVINHKNIIVDFQHLLTGKERIVVWLEGSAVIKSEKVTVFDFIYQITLYNRTAQSKINLFWSQNFIKELLK